MASTQKWWYVAPGATEATGVECTCPATHGFQSALDALRATEQRLYAEINERTERLNAIRASIFRASAAATPAPVQPGAEREG